MQDDDFTKDIKQILNINLNIDERIKTIEVNQQEMKTQVDQILVDFSKFNYSCNEKMDKMEGIVNNLETKLLFMFWKLRYLFR